MSTRTAPPFSPQCKESCTLVVATYVYIVSFTKAQTLSSSLLLQISKENVDNVQRSRFSRSDYADYIDYPPRILMRIHQTSLNTITLNRSQQLHQTPPLQPKLKLKGTVEEKCFSMPLPAAATPDLDISLPVLTPQHSGLQGPDSQTKTPTERSFPRSRAERGCLVSGTKQQSIHSTPDLKELGEKVTPYVHPKWYHIGIQLGLKPVTLNSIEIKYPHDILRRLDEVFYEWICRSEEDPTWMVLTETLRLDSIGEEKLANELEKSFELMT